MRASGQFDVMRWTVGAGNGMCPGGVSRFIMLGSSGRAGRAMTQHLCLIILGLSVVSSHTVSCGMRSLEAERR